MAVPCSSRLGSFASNNGQSILKTVLLLKTPTHKSTRACHHTVVRSYYCTPSRSTNANVAHQYTPRNWLSSRANIRCISTTGHLINNFTQQQQLQARVGGVLRAIARRGFATAPPGSIFPLEHMRNIAIIAHVDHGKTSLVDQLLQQSGAATITSSDERLMDSNALEKERGITIFSKCAAVTLVRDNVNYRLNIVDTPGHADFGGEVERVLSMVDGVILVVDANEGAMAQTKYVLSKALKRGLKAVVVLNKADRPGALSRVGIVESELLDLFALHLVDDSQLEYPTLYASAKMGWAVASLDAFKGEPAAYTGTMQPLFDAILTAIPPPKVDRTAPFSMLATQLEPNAFLGKCLIGRIQSGMVRTGDTLSAVDADGKVISEGRVTRLFVRQGMSQVTVDEAAAGDIVTVAGFPTSTVNHTLVAPGGKPIPSTPVDPPTLAMSFGVNDSPFAGQEGQYLTSGMISERLERECESNVSIQVIRSESESLEVRGRGELQLGVLLETMRREGFEIAVSAPRVLFRKDENGRTLEPIEELTLDMDTEFSGLAIEKLSLRKGILKNFEEQGGRARLQFEIPVRGLIGYQREFKNDCRGTGIFNHRFLTWAPHCGGIDVQRKGVMISTATGECTSYTLENLEQRGVLFVSPSTKVYAGQIVGEHSRDMDLEVNPVKGKHLTNVRSVVKDEFVRLTPPRPITLETSLSYIQDDELMEVTPTSIRLRKRDLDPNKRRVNERKKRSDTFVN